MPGLPVLHALNGRRHSGTTVGFREAFPALPSSPLLALYLSI